MKKFGYVAMVAVLVIVAASSSALSKEAKEKDIKINPKVDFTKLDLAKLTIFQFENTAGEGQDILDTMYDEMAQMFNRNKIAASLITPKEIGDKKDEFALGDKDAKDSGDSQAFKSSPTDLVVSGKLLRMEGKEKKSFMKDAKYWTTSIEVFIYSKSLNTIVYKANLTRIYEQKGGSGKNARRTVFRSCLEEAFQPFFDKLAHPDAKPAE